MDTDFSFDPMTKTVTAMYTEKTTHRGILSQIINKLVEDGWASEREIVTEWDRILSLQIIDKGYDRDFSTQKK